MHGITFRLNLQLFDERNGMFCCETPLSTPESVVVGAQLNVELNFLGGMARCAVGPHSATVP